jgi:hypothetical protein
LPGTHCHLSVIFQPENDLVCRLKLFYHNMEMP